LIGYFFDIALALGIAALVCSMIAMFNLSEYGSDHLSHFFYKWRSLIGQEYYTDVGWWWRVVSIILILIGWLVIALSPISSVFGQG